MSTHRAQHSPGLRSVALTLTGGRYLGPRIRALRVATREKLPMGLRIAWRRWPAAMAYALSPPSLERGPLQGFDHLQSQRTSPLRRPGTTYDPDLQGAKEANVRRAASLLDGVVIAPGQVFSWHETVGPPLRVRGFEPGPELHDGQLSMGVGGGLCQVANLVFWLAMTSGMTLVERHRHGLDLFPDSARDVPFGCGATVFHPHRDLKFSNPLTLPLRLSVWVEDGRLHGEARLPRDPGCRYEIVEIWHRYRREGDAIWRENHLARRCLPVDGPATTQPLATHRARVCYPVEDV